MSKAVVIVVKHTGVALTGLTRNAGGPLPSVRDLVGDGIDATIDQATFLSLPPSALDVVEVTATEAEILDISGRMVESGGTSAALTRGVLNDFGAVSWDPTGHTLSVDVTEANFVGPLIVLDGQGDVFSLSVRRAQPGVKKLSLGSATTPLVVMADGYNPKKAS